MYSTIKIGVIGDYDGRPSHMATDEAIKHCACHLGLKPEIQWLPTVSLETGREQSLNGFDAFWCAPGNPYKSAQGAMNAIQFARENNHPFIGTCGGFQHVVLEFARDVLSLIEVKQIDFDPYTPNLFISALNCSLIGETRNINLTKGTKAAQIYNTKKAEERYNCNFELNDQFRNQLTAFGFVVAGTDEAGHARILEMPQNKFFIATLFQPQLSSTPGNPHKLILAFLKSADKSNQRQT